MNVLALASNFPDRFYPTITPWSKLQVDSLCKYTDCNIQVVAPRPHSIPYKLFPYHNFSRLPIREVAELGYSLHFPRYFYLLPKRIFFPLTGISYSNCVTRYCLQNISKPDLVHAKSSYMDGYGALKICKRWDIPLIFDVHGTEEFGEYLQIPIIRKFSQEAISSAKKILCAAKWQVKKGIEIGIPEEKLEYVPLGIDIESNSINFLDKEMVKESFGIPSNTILLFIGHLIKRKNVHILLDALSNIDKKIFNSIQVIIIGEGPEKQRLIRQAINLNIIKNVKFLGSVTDPELKKWYSLADIFILPSLSEGKPTVINEAMVNECAIIASNVNGIPEQVNHGYNGFLFEPNDSKMLSQLINHLVKDTELMKQMGKNSRKKIIADGITWENYAKKVFSIYESVLN